MLKEPKQFGARGALKVLGKHPGDGQPVALYSGRYGPYVKHGKVNATLPDPSTRFLIECTCATTSRSRGSTTSRE